MWRLGKKREAAGQKRRKRSLGGGGGGGTAYQSQEPIGNHLLSEKPIVRKDNCTGCSLASETTGRLNRLHNRFMA